MKIRTWIKFKKHLSRTKLCNKNMAIGRKHRLGEMKIPSNVLHSLSEPGGSKPRVLAILSVLFFSTWHMLWFLRHFIRGVLKAHIQHVCLPGLVIAWQKQLIGIHLSETHLRVCDWVQSEVAFSFLFQVLHTSVCLPLVARQMRSCHLKCPESTKNL